MNKQIRTLDATSIINDLPSLPFVSIMNVQDAPHRNLSGLPHAQINLVDPVTASAVRVLLRFEKVTLDEYTDPGVAVTLLAAWIKKLVEGLNARGDGREYKFAMPNQDRPYMPNAPTWQPGLDGWQQQQRAFMERGAGGWPNARPFGQQMFGGFGMSNTGYSPGDYEANMVAQSLLRDISLSKTQSVPSLSTVYMEGKNGGYLRFEGSLGDGVTFAALPVPEEKEMGFISFLESVKNAGYSAGYFHVGGVKYLYTSGHQHGYAEEMRTLLEDSAIETAFNELWIKQFKAMSLNALPVTFLSLD